MSATDSDLVICNGRVRTLCDVPSSRRLKLKTKRVRIVSDKWTGSAWRPGGGRQDVPTRRVLQYRNNYIIVKIFFFCLIPLCTCPPRRSLKQKRNGENNNNNVRKKKKKKKTSIPTRKNNFRPRGDKRGRMQITRARAPILYGQNIMYPIRRACKNNGWPVCANKEPRRTSFVLGPHHPFGGI